MKEGSADQGKWRVRVVPQGVVTTKELAKIMEQNCTVKSSDINAVLRELAETMKTSLLDGNRVVLDGLGGLQGDAQVHWHGEEGGLQDWA